MIESLLKRKNTNSVKAPVEPRICCYVCGQLIPPKSVRYVKVNGQSLYSICSRKQCEEIVKKTVQRRMV